ncbi:MAG: hypothetical protein ACLFSZ_01460 [Puniceicoccaceae bacterium]
MGFLKKYPVFCGLLLLFALALGAGIYLALGEREELAEAERALRSDADRLRQLSAGVPYDDGKRIPPTPAARESLEERLEEVRGDLGRIREIMKARTDSVLNDPADEFTFLPKLQSFIARLKSDAANRVRLETDEAFGFARFARRARQPSAEDVPLLDMQRQVLGYILRQLIEAAPQAILAVEREMVESPAEGDDGRPETMEDIFTIPEFVTARSNEYIDTYGFRLVFTGRTDVLRRFINRLAAFELPLIVRSIEVTPVEEEDEPEQEVAGGGEESELFALFGEGETQPEESPEEEDVDPDREPVITENKSKFTVVIEFVELRTEAVAEMEAETEAETETETES